MLKIDPRSPGDVSRDETAALRTRRASRKIAVVYFLPHEAGGSFQPRSSLIDVAIDATQQCLAEVHRFFVMARKSDSVDSRERAVPRRHGGIMLFQFFFFVFFCVLLFA